MSERCAGESGRRGRNADTVDPVMYRSLFENNHAVMLIIDPEDGRIVDANPAAASFYGWSRDELRHRRIGDINVHDSGAVREAMTLAQSATNQHVFFTHRLADGSSRDVEVFSGPVTLRGRPLLYSIIHDVTERRLAERVAREAAALFTQVFAASPVAINIFRLSDERSIQVNDAYARLTGYEREEIEGHTARELGLFVDAGGRTDWIARLRQGLPVPSQDARLRTKSGAIRHVLASLDVMHLGGEPVVLVMATDITVRQRADLDRAELLEELTEAQRVLLSVIEDHERSELALRDSEQRFRRAVLDAPFPILLHAEDGEILLVSRSWCEITGYTADELRTIGEWTERAYGLRQASVRADIDALYALEGRKYEGDYPITTKDGTSRIWEFSSAPLGCLPDGRRTVISMALDVTERRRAEAEVRQLNEQLEQRVQQRTTELQALNHELESFSYSVSHDLRAPLRAIDGFIQILSDGYTTQFDAEGQRLIAIIRSEARRMGQLIDDLLAFARVNRAPLRASVVDLTGICREAVDACLARAGAGAQTVVHVEDLPPALGDPALLYQVFVNLIANALKFSGGRSMPTVEIRGHREDRMVVVSVTDNGVGFDMRYVDRLFKVFQRLHGEHEFEGTGVGLALVHRIVSRHGGRVTALGTPDHGATFTFSVPASNHDVPGDEAQP